jgi:hypothetical protein
VREHAPHLLSSDRRQTAVAWTRESTLTAEETAREVASEPTQAIPHMRGAQRHAETFARPREAPHVVLEAAREHRRAIFVVAVLTNYLWELAQAPLYVSMESFRAVWWHCFVASLGDGLLVVGIVVAGRVALRRHTWFVHPGVAGYGVMVAAGLIIGVTVEWVAVYRSKRWIYTAWMPRIPGSRSGWGLSCKCACSHRSSFTSWRGGVAERHRPDNAGLGPMGQPRGKTRSE